MGTYFVYILSNDRQTVLYAGVTNDLTRRMGEHRAGTLGGFTARYNVTKLVYYEEFHEINDAIARESRSRAVHGGEK